MSQEKVNKYKEYKKNRKEILAKEKKKKMLGRVAAWGVLIIAIGGIGTAAGISFYNSYKAAEAAKPNYKSETFNLPDYAGIKAEETTEAASEEGSKAATEAASEEGSKAATEAASEEGSEAATEQTASEEGSEAATEQAAGEQDSEAATE